MSRRCSIATLVLTSVLPVSAHADVSNQSRIGGRVADQAASRLAAEAQLSRYANYSAASSYVRELGRRMTAEVTQRAATQHICIPSVMNDSDQRLVHRLESLQGDDFDVAYMTLFSGQAAPCSGNRPQ